MRSGVLPVVRRYTLSIVCGLVVCALVVSSVSVSPATFASTVWSGTVQSPTATFNVLRWATPEIIVGLAFAVGKRAGLFNLGLDGQLYVGALATTVVGIYLPLPPFVAPIAALTAGMAAGALWASIAAWLLNWFGVTEVVSTLMLNYVAVLLTTWLVKRFLLQHLNGQASYTIATPMVRRQAQLPSFSSGSQANVGILVAMLLAAVLWLVLQRSRAGYEFRSVGASARYAAYDGQNVRRVRLNALALSGAMAGLAGAIEILGVQHNFVQGFSNNLGFDGIIVSIIGAHSPVGIVFAGTFFGALKNTGLELALSGNVSSYVVTLFTAVFIFAFGVHPRLRRRG